VAAHPNIPWHTVRYSYYSSDDLMFGSVVLDFHVAQQECQAVAQVSLHWTETDPGIWEATDPKTGTVYEINEVHY